MYIEVNKFELLLFTSGESSNWSCTCMPPPKKKSCDMPTIYLLTRTLIMVKIGLKLHDETTVRSSFILLINFTCVYLNTPVHTFN